MQNIYMSMNTYVMAYFSDTLYVSSQWIWEKFFDKNRNLLKKALFSLFLSFLQMILVRVNSFVCLYEAGS